MNMPRSTLSAIKSVLDESVGWFMLLALISIVRAKDFLNALKDRLEEN